MNRLLRLVALTALVGCTSGKQETSRPGQSQDSRVTLGRYQTDTLAAADAGGRVITLELKSDSSAVLMSEWAGKPTISQMGTFSTDGPNLSAAFPAHDSAAPMTLHWRLISSRLVPVDWDRALYGPAGLTLHLR